MKMNDKTYNVLKWVVMIVLPAIAALYSTLSLLWGFPYMEQIVGTITAIATFLGAMIGVSTANYNKTKNVEEK